MKRDFEFEVLFVGRLYKKLKTLRTSGELNRRKSVIGRSWNTTVSQGLWSQGKWRLPHNGMCLFSSLIHLLFLHSSQYCFSRLLISMYNFVPKDFFLCILCTAILSHWILFTCLPALLLHSLVVDKAFRHCWRLCWHPWSGLLPENPVVSMVEYCCQRSC